MIVLRQAGVIEHLQKELAELKQQIKDINDRNDGLSAKVEELAKKAARQAAPFRIEEQHRVLERKKPGRPKGHPGVCRAVPDHVDEEVVVPLVQCPHCRGQVSPRRSVLQYVEELPVVRPHVTKLTTEEADCPQRQKAVRSTHPLQVSRRRLEKQQDRLFTFLDVEEVEATNNLAERQLRPAVIARKVSRGNKTPKGAHTWEILTSLAATCAQQAESFAHLVSQSALLSAAR